mmetsp:Transcript_18714/g.33393  ORF Transcript_18714/g.33393 Transcript_18714/m.33393 type:complete len:243 (-) Transcript_18714:966-1694(-)
MLLGGDITQERGASGADSGGADGRGDVVVAGRDVGGEGAEGVKGRLRAPVQLLVHVFLDLVQRHVAGALVHHLHVLLPGPACKLPLHLELEKLRRVVGVLDAAGAEAVADGERDVVLGANVQNLVPVLVGEILLVLQQRQLGVDGAAAADDAGEARGCERDGGEQHAGVDGPVVNPLLRLLHQRLAKQLPRDVLHHAVSLLQALVDGDGADGDGRVAHHPLPRRVDVVAGGEVHDGVRAPHR